MSLLVVGVSYRTADVRLLEQLAVSQADNTKLLDELHGYPNVTEAMVLSTCNRVEVYTAVDTFHGGLADVMAVLAQQGNLEVATLAEHCYVHYADAAVEHVFSVAAGLDSMVLGEAQILGQLRAAYAAATEADAVGSTLHTLLQQALRIGKRVHSDTEIDQNGASVVSEALVDAERVLGSLAGRRALLVGAGAMGRLAAAQLSKAGIGQVIVANRTIDNAERLTETLRASGVSTTAIDLTELPAQISEIDVLLACTGAMEAVIELNLVKLGRATSRTPLVVCDLGLPRDVDSRVGELPGVTLIDLQTLRQRLATAPTGLQIDRAAAIVAAEIREYLAGQRRAEVTPTVTALRRRAAEMIEAELLRLDSRLPDLDDLVRAELSKTVRRVVDKLLHTPTVRVKQLATAPDGTDYAEALRELFQLEAQVPAAVSTPRNVQIEHGGEIR